MYDIKTKSNTLIARQNQHWWWVATISYNNMGITNLRFAVTSGLQRSLITWLVIIMELTGSLTELSKLYRTYGLGRRGCDGLTLRQICLKYRFLPFTSGRHWMLVHVSQIVRKDYKIAWNQEENNPQEITLLLTFFRLFFYVRFYHFAPSL